MFALANSAILSRELVGRLRSWRTLASILAIATISSSLVLLRWPSDATVDAVSQGAMLVFRPLVFALMVAVILMVPAFPATSFVAERRKHTLALLLNSPAGPASIYLSKLISNFSLSMLLISVSLPAFAACYAMGGVSVVNHILPLVLVLAAMALQYSALGLWVSIRASSTDSGLRLTYAAILGLSVLSLSPLVFAGGLDGLYAQIGYWLSALSPVSALLQITSSQSLTSNFGQMASWPIFVGVSSLITVILAVVTVRTLDPILLDKARPVGKVRTNKGGIIRRLAFLIDPQKRKAGIPRILNPVMVKEFRTRKFGRLHWLIRMVAICAIVSLLITVLAASGVAGWGVERIAAPMVLMQIALLLLIGPSLGANLIASEVESGGWQLLRVAPINPVRIVTGKLMSAAWTMLLVLLATLPGYIVMGLIEPKLSGQVSNVVISLLFAITLVVSISSCVSAFCRTTATATVSSYAILLTLFAGTMLIWLGREEPFGPLLVERVLAFNPAAVALSEMNTPGFQQFSLAPIGWWISGIISGIALIVFCGRVWLMTRPD